jgi:hypothetical protein
LAAAVNLSTDKRPLYEGRIHFIRRVSETGTVRVLNVDWQVSPFDPTQGVWVTLELRTEGATLSIFDAAPDAETRDCLTIYPFSLKETVQPHPATKNASPAEAVQEESSLVAVKTLPVLPTREIIVGSRLNRQSPVSGRSLLLAAARTTRRLTQRLFFTMF